MTTPVETIKEVVAAHFRVPLHTMNTPSPRGARTRRPRAVAVYIAARELDVSHAWLSRQFTLRTGTSRSTIDSVEGQMKRDTEFSDEIEAIADRAHAAILARRATVELITATTDRLRADLIAMADDDPEGILKKLGEIACGT